MWTQLISLHEFRWQVKKKSAELFSSTRGISNPAPSSGADVLFVYLQFNFRDHLHERIVIIQIPRMFVCLTGWIRYLK